MLPGARSDPRLALEPGSSSFSPNFHRSLAIRDAVAALHASPWRNAARALLVLGFGLKIRLVPLQVWMPLTYAAAPIPAAAVLRGIQPSRRRALPRLERAKLRPEYNDG